MEQEEFSRLANDCLPKLRNTVRKQIGHPEQTDDIVQEALTKSWQNIKTFKGDAAFCTWLCTIAIRCGMDYLRSVKTWRSKAQMIYADQCMKNPQLGLEIDQSMSDPNIDYQVNEHIAYCFTCVGRSLIPIEQATLILKEVLNLTNMEGAKALVISESKFRQHLSLARKSMQSKFDSLCSLVNKAGVCYQCKGLRDGFPEERKGAWDTQMTRDLSFDIRIKIVRDANIDNGKTQILHELFWKRTADLELQEIGDESTITRCGHDE